MLVLAVAVAGRPAPQGSKKFVGMRGKFPVLVEQSKYVEPWREDVRDATRMAMRVTGGSWPLNEPLHVALDVYLARAASNRDTHPYGHNSGDIDKYARAILDALTMSGVVTDDCLFVSCTAHKWWATSTRSPGATIRISTLEEDSCQTTLL